MPNGHYCSNCGFSLVLLEKRMKFKCAKCGRLFPQKEVESESFRRWNKKMRETEEHNLRVESQKPKLSEEEKKLRYNASQRKYRNKNRDKIKTYVKEYEKKRPDRNGYVKELYRRNISKSRLQKRILYYRLRQKLLALKNLEFIDNKFSKALLEDSVATFYITKYWLKQKRL